MVTEALGPRRKIAFRANFERQAMAQGKKPLVVVTRRLPDSVEMRMRELFDARLNHDDKPMSQAQLAEAAKTADVIVPTVTDHIDRSVISGTAKPLRANSPSMPDVSAGVSSYPLSDMGFGSPALG